MNPKGLKKALRKLLNQKEIDMYTLIVIAATVLGYRAVLYALSKVKTKTTSVLSKAMGAGGHGEQYRW